MCPHAAQRSSCNGGTVLAVPIALVRVLLHFGQVTRGSVGAALIGRSERNAEISTPLEPA
jgi:hypothetical protein